MGDQNGQARRCSKCGESRPVSEFYVQNKETGRLNPWCKSCYRDWYRSRGGYAIAETRACECCGELFEAWTKRQRFCGPNCKARARTARNNPPVQRPCKQCGTPITTTRSNKVFCSPSCAEEQRRRDGRLAATSRKNLLKSKYGITPADFDALLASQNGRCAICGTDKPNAQHDQWHIDHCHKTGKVRGLLCGPCNTGIGQMQDDPQRLRSAASYLEAHMK